MTRLTRGTLCHDRLPALLPESSQAGGKTIAVITQMSVAATAKVSDLARNMESRGISLRVWHTTTVASLGDSLERIISENDKVPLHIDRLFNSTLRGPASCSCGLHFKLFTLLYALD